MYRYQYICELGLGGRGRVVKAMDMQDGEVVALKSSSCIPSSLTEVAILNIADHPSKLRVGARAFVEVAELMRDSWNWCARRYCAHEGRLPHRSWAGD
jgi:hypothetical protein